MLWVDLNTNKDLKSLSISRKKLSRLIALSGRTAPFV